MLEKINFAKLSLALYVLRRLRMIKTPQMIKIAYYYFTFVQKYMRQYHTVTPIPNGSHSIC